MYSMVCPWEDATMQKYPSWIAREFKCDGEGEEEGRHKEQNVPTATHQDTLRVRYESAAAKEALMPKGDYVRIWDKECHWHLWVFLRHLTVSFNLRRDTLHSPLACGESQAAVKGDNFNKEPRADRPAN